MFRTNYILLLTLLVIVNGFACSGKHDSLRGGGSDSKESGSTANAEGDANPVGLDSASVPQVLSGAYLTVSVTKAGGIASIAARILKDGLSISSQLAELGISIRFVLKINGQEIPAAALSLSELGRGTRGANSVTGSRNVGAGTQETAKTWNVDLSAYGADPTIGVMAFATVDGLKQDVAISESTASQLARADALKSAGGNGGNPVVGASPVIFRHGMSFTGNFAQNGSADQLCETRALSFSESTWAKGLTKFVGVLGTRTQIIEKLKSKNFPANAIIKNVKNEFVAANLELLLSQAEMALPLILNVLASVDAGGLLSLSTPTWTGFNFDGIAMPNNCSDWHTDSEYHGNVDIPDGSLSTTSPSFQTCDSSATIYCMAW